MKQTKGPIVKYARKCLRIPIHEMCTWSKLMEFQHQWWKVVSRCHKDILIRTKCNDVPCKCFEIDFITFLGYYEAEEVILDAQELPDLVPIEGDKILCLKCNKSLGSMQAAKKHFNLIHETNQRAFCQICQKVFKNSHSRNVHIKRHHGVSASMMKNAITMPKH